MKKIFYSLLLLYCSVAHSQVTDSTVWATMATAYQYLHGYFKPHEPSKAFTLYQQCANWGNAKAMNAIAMQYKLGLGTDTSETQSFRWFQKAAVNGYATAWYNLGLMYKYGSGCTLNYENAYTCFKKAADMQEPSGFYAQGYMLYKGLGCTQSYLQAFALFKKGASLANKASCMYFMGLCYRNGYGVIVNNDSALYWLSKASSLGYQFAGDELASKEPENAPTTNELAAKIAGIQKINALAGSNSLNKYTRVEQSLPAADIEGIYSGYLIKYDWSGEHIIAASTLNLSLTYADEKLSGLWTEDDSLTVSLTAELNSKALLFKNMQYSKTNHYSPATPITYSFQGASLQLIKNKDSVYLAGNIQLFSPDKDKKEPEKPLYVVLTRTNIVQDTATTHFINNNKVNTLKVYPNPFNNILNIDFELKEISEVYTQLFTADGKLLYNNSATKLEAGNYTLPVQFNVPVGAYIVKLHCGKETKIATVIKQ